MKTNHKRICRFFVAFAMLLLSSCAKTPSSQADLLLYPNPAYSYLTLRGDNMLHYTLLDGGGQIVKEGDITCNPFLIDVHGFVPGNYLLQVVTTEEVIIEAVSITGFNAWDYPYYP